MTDVHRALDTVIALAADVASMTRDEVHDALRVLSGIKRRISSLEAAFVQRHADLEQRGAKPSLVRATGMSTREASDALVVADVVASISGAGSALESGVVSAAHLRELDDIVRPTPTDPSIRARLCRDAAELIPRAAGKSVSEFRRIVTDWLTDHHAATIRKRQTDARGLTFFKVANGNIGMKLILTPVEGSEVQGMVEHQTSADYRAMFPERADVNGGHNAAPIEERRADALLKILRGQGKGAASGKPTAIVLIDEAKLDATLVGHGKVPLTDLTGFISRADILWAIRDAKGFIMNFGRSQRFASEMQKLALIAQYGGKCATPGCDAPWWELQADHVPDWSKGGQTNLATMEPRCGRCHMDRTVATHSNASTIASRRKRKNRKKQTDKQRPSKRTEGTNAEQRGRTTAKRMRTPRPRANRTRTPSPSSSARSMSTVSMSAMSTSSTSSPRTTQRPTTARTDSSRSLARRRARRVRRIRTMKVPVQRLAKPPPVHNTASI